MAILPAQLAAFKERVLAAKRVIVFYDDDGDGLSSYLLLYRARGGDNGSTIGVRVHASASVPAEFALRKIEENGGDLVVILDKPYAEQALLESCPLPIFWLDHHEPQTAAVASAKETTYFNPRVEDDKDNRCTTHWVWHALGRPEDLWIAALGSISDWQMTDIAALVSCEENNLIRMIME